MPQRSSSRLRRSAAVIDRWDVATSNAIAKAEFPTVLDRGLPLLTWAADKSKLWMALSGAMLASGHQPARRAAARGLASIGVASLLANQVGKRALPRRRPNLANVPIRRVASHVPISSSFPSGHSASAAAFAVATAIECPPLAVPVGVLAGAVMFSRIYTGVHFTSDVLAGATLGAAVAGIGAATFPAHHEQVIRSGAEPPRPQPPRPTGAGVVAVLNNCSGSFGQQVLDTLRSELPDAELIEVVSGDDIVAVMRKAAERAQVLGAAGGDGTINAAAAAAMAADVPLLVIPAGTFDHFAKDIELADLDDALGALREGRAICVDVGDVDGKPFLNTASLGSYPEFVKIRERFEGRLGKPIAAAIAIVRVLRHCPPLDAEVDGVSRRLLLLFIGNGDYRPRGFVPRWRRRLDAGHLDVRFADEARGHSTWRLLAATLSADLYKSSSYVEARQPAVTVTISGNTGYLARDGEIEDAPSEVRFSVRRQALTVYRGPVRTPER
ncbi:MAG: phosphatase PAP2 family protein [Actinomycetota bacterium]|nr:phosphatase PAP2 family protein [Actinomycetota bacterium]